MALEMGMEIRFFDCGTPLAGELRVLRFIEKSSDSEKNSTAVRRVRDCVPLGNEKGLSQKRGSPTNF